MTKPVYELLAPTKKFKRELKKIIKKFKLDSSFIEVEFEKLLANPDLANNISHDPRFVKMRIRIPNVTGKRGGLRAILLKDTNRQTFTPCICYHKSDKEDVTKQELEAAFDDIVNSTDDDSQEQS